MAAARACIGGLTHHRPTLSGGNTMKLHLKTSAAVLVAAASCVAISAPAQANSADKVRTGSCTGTSDWKLKVGPEDGRLEVEGQVDSNRVGQTWTWRIVHNGSVSATGTRTTLAPSGSFTVRRTVLNRAGTDSIVWRADNVRSGETCRGTLSF
jgi:hypothetical protein